MQLVWHAPAAVPAGADVHALLEGARTVSREGDRVAAIALLWSAVGIAPTDLTAHRHLAAALWNAGDRDAAAAEYARFASACVRAHDLGRARAELDYGLALLGPAPALVDAASRVPKLEVHHLRALEAPAVARGRSLSEPLRRLAVVTATLVAASAALVYASSILLLVD